MYRKGENIVKQDRHENIHRQCGGNYQQILQRTVYKIDEHQKYEQAQKGTEIYLVQLG